jgi:hypothetical protein
MAIRLGLFSLDAATVFPSVIRDERSSAPIRPPQDTRLLIYIAGLVRCSELRTHSYHSMLRHNACVELRREDYSAILSTKSGGAERRNTRDSGNATSAAGRRTSPIDADGGECLTSSDMPRRRSWNVTLPLAPIGESRWPPRSPIPEAHGRMARVRLFSAQQGLARRCTATRLGSGAARLHGVALHVPARS